LNTLTTQQQIFAEANRIS